MQKLIGLAKSLAVAFAALQAVQVFASMAAEGVKFNAAIEDATLGIASLITAQAKLKDANGVPVEGAQALTVALGLAEDQMFKLRVAGLETAATTTQLADAFQAAVGSGLGASLTLDQIRGITIQVVQAAGALGVPMDQISQEVRSILDGQIDMNSQVATTLGITNEQVETWKASGKLVEELNKRLESFSEAGKAAANTFSVIKSNAEEAVQSLAGDVFKGFFEQLKGGIKDATAGLFDTQTLSITPQLADAANLARDLATVVGTEVADSLRGVVQAVKDFSDWLGKNWEEVQAIKGSVGQLWQQLMKLVAPVVQVALGIADAAVKTGILTKTIQTLSLILASVRDGFRFIAGVVVGIGALILKLMISPFKDLIDLSAKAADALGFADTAKQLGEVAAALGSVSERGMQAAQDIMQPLLDGKGAVAEVVAGFDEIAAAAEKAAAARNKPASATGPSATAARGSVAGKKFEPKIPGADGNQLNKDDLEQQLKRLEQQYADGLISIAAYFRERSRLQKAAIDAEIAAEAEKQGKLAKTDENGQRDAATKIALLGRKKKAIEQENARGQLEAERELASQSLDLQAQKLEAEGKLEAAASIRTFERFKALLQRMRTEGDTKNVGLIEGLIDIDKARARFAELKAEFDRQTGELQRKVEAIRSGVASGDIKPQAAQGMIDQATATAQPGLAETNRQVQDLATRINDPAIKQGAEDISAALRKIGEEGASGLTAAVQDLRTSLAQMDAQLAKSAVGAGVDALAGLFDDLVTGSKSAGEALRDFVVGFVRSMVQIAARALATFLVLSMLDAVYPGLGKSVAAAGAAGAVGGAVGARVKHGGGSASHGQQRSVPSWVFAGAPRFHGGSDVLGVKPGEIPAILQTGERVQSRAEVAAAGKGDGGGNTRIINTVDPAIAADWVNGPSGEKSILNHITRNAATLRHVLR